MVAINKNMDSKYNKIYISYTYTYILYINIIMCDVKFRRTAEFHTVDTDSNNK